MTMAKPVWFDYIEWDFSEPSFPRNVGFVEGTPQEIIDAYERDQKRLKRMERMEREHPEVCIQW